MMLYAKARKQQHVSQPVHLLDSRRADDGHDNKKSY